jgi:hypothetical protein
LLIVAIAVSASILGAPQTSVGDQTYESRISEIEANESNRRAKTDSEYLSLFNSGRREYWKLPVGELPASGSPALTFDDAVNGSEIIVLAVLERVEFFSSELSGAPAGTYWCRVVEPIHGSLERDAFVNVTTLGGPVKDAYGEAFVALPQVAVERPGQLSVLMVNWSEAGKDYEQVHVRNQYLFDEQEKLARTDATQDNGLSGLGREAFLTLVREKANAK